MLKIPERELHAVKVTERKLISGVVAPQATTKFMNPYEVTVDLLARNDNKFTVSAPFGNITIRVAPAQDDYVYNRRIGAKTLHYRDGIESLRQDIRENKLSAYNFKTIIDGICRDFELTPQENFVDEMNALMKRSDFAYGKDYSYLYEGVLTRPGWNRADDTIFFSEIEANGRFSAYIHDNYVHPMDMHLLRVFDEFLPVVQKYNGNYDPTLQKYEFATEKDRDDFVREANKLFRDREKEAYGNLVSTENKANESVVENSTEDVQTGHPVEENRAEIQPTNDETQGGLFDVNFLGFVTLNP